MSTIELKTYDILKNRFGEQEASTIMEFFDEKAARKFEDKKADLVTKEDLAKAIADVRVEMREIKADMIKWMFIFWIGQLAAIIAIIKFVM